MELKYTVSGQWDNEPDSKDWEAHGLNCAMRRNMSSGNWCGYVGVPAGHPWYGKNYSDKVSVSKDIINRPIELDKIGIIGLFCQSLSEDNIADGEIRIEMAIDVHGGLTYSSSGADGCLLKGLWWFGFDCAHHGDLSPAMLDYRFGHEIYRDEIYVTSETESLARQISALDPAPAID